MVNTDQHKDRGLTHPPTTFQKVLCYHSDRAKARASHCWAVSSRVRHTTSQRSDVTQVSRWGHHSPAFSLWPQTLKQIEKWRRQKHEMTKLNMFITPVQSQETNWSKLLCIRLFVAVGSVVLFGWCSVQYGGNSLCRLQYVSLLWRDANVIFYVDLVAQNTAYGALWWPRG